MEDKAKRILIKRNLNWLLKSDITSTIEKIYIQNILDILEYDDFAYIFVQVKKFGIWMNELVDMYKLSEFGDDYFDQRKLDDKIKEWIESYGKEDE
ncbi:MAG: hypothetical protein ACRCUM_02725 [Mycoplasmoidaceae bacterium]